jgi:hypothetical protein
MSNAPTLEIKVDQAGYAIGATKIGFLVQPVAGQTARFILRRQEDGEAVFEGSWSPPVFDPDSGDDFAQESVTRAASKITSTTTSGAVRSGA